MWRQIMISDEISNLIKINYDLQEKSMRLN